jgi:hypothetical protein
MVLPFLLPLRLEKTVGLKLCTRRSAWLTSIRQHEFATVSPAIRNEGKGWETDTERVFGIAPASIEQWYPSLGGRLIPVRQPCPVRHNSNLAHCIRLYLHTHLASIVWKGCCFVAEGKLSRAVITANGKTTPHLLVDSRSQPKPELSSHSPIPCRTHRHVLQVDPAGFRA